MEINTKIGSEKTGDPLLDKPFSELSNEEWADMEEKYPDRCKKIKDSMFAFSNFVKEMPKFVPPKLSESLYKPQDIIPHQKSLKNQIAEGVSSGVSLALKKEIKINSVRAGRDIIGSPMQVGSPNSKQSNKSIINNTQIKLLEDFVNVMSEVKMSDIEASMGYPNYDVGFILPMHVINEALENEEYSVGKIKGALRKLKPVFKELGPKLLKVGVLIAFDACLLYFGIPPIAVITAE